MSATNLGVSESTRILYDSVEKFGERNVYKAVEKVILKVKRTEYCNVSLFDKIGRHKVGLLQLYRHSRTVPYPYTHIYI